MKKHSVTRNGFIHLYNPKEEGIGAYDVNYINAYNKNKKLKLVANKINERRQAA